MAKLTREDVEWIVKKAQEKGERPNLNRVDLDGMNLSGIHPGKVNFYEASLRGTCFRMENLRGANFHRADLYGVDFSFADLVGADLSETGLSEANLRNANLSRVNLRKAYLGGADLSDADLSETYFSEASVGWTNFGNVDLSVVKGLETVEHVGPSYIDFYTIQRSKGQIPEVFLRGAGLSDTFITYITSLAGQAIQYYSCFISYSSKDEAFAQRLHADLQQKGVRCWFAPEDMKIGDKIRPAIDQSIRIHDKLLIILSEHSINSTWVEKEVETAFEEEAKRNQIVLFPVRLDQAVMKTDQAWAADIRRTRHIGDFSRWKDHDAYQPAFERLLRDLKAEG